MKTMGLFGRKKNNDETELQLLDTQNYKELIDKGCEFGAIENYSMAIECFEMAIKLEPSRTDGYYNKGTALVRMKQYDAAIEYYDMAIKLQPDSMITITAKVRLLSSLEKYQEAIEYCDMAIKLQPEDEGLFYDKGTNLMFLEKYQEAIECFEIAIKLKPDYTNALNNKAVVLNSLGKNQEANDTIHLRDLSKWTTNNFIDYIETHTIDGQYVQDSNICYTCGKEIEITATTPAGVTLMTLKDGTYEIHTHYYEECMLEPSDAIFTDR